MTFLKNNRKILLSYAIGAIVVLFGLTGIIGYIGSLKMFFKDVFFWNNIMYRNLPHDNKFFILIFFNLNLFIAVSAYLAYIFSGIKICNKKQIGVKVLFIVSIIYLSFFVIHDLFFLPVTIMDINSVLNSETVFSFIKNSYNHFGFVFFSVFFIIMSHFLKFEKK